MKRIEKFQLNQVVILAFHFWPQHLVSNGQQFISSTDSVTRGEIHESTQIFL